MEDKSKKSSEARASKSDAQKSKEALEPKQTNQQKMDNLSSSTKEERRRKPSLSTDGSSSDTDESYESASEDAEGYDRDRQRIN